MFPALFGSLLVTSASVAGCSSSDPGPAAPNDSGVDAVVDSGPADPLAVPCTDTKDAIYGDPGTLPADKGAILKCSPADKVAKADLQKKAVDQGYKGKDFTSGMRTYRITYRTERGTTTPTAGYTSAMVFLPDTPRNAKVPVVLLGRGSRGQGPKCAPSRYEPEGAYVQSDYESNIFPLVGAGYAVIAPDLSGYANFGAKDNPVAAYGNGNDNGKALLDASRAIRKLVPSILSDKNVIVGHSQGGHVALSGAALSSTYGLDGTLAGVAVYAPLWLAQRTWGALLVLADSYPIATSPTPNAVSIWYHYTTGEILDGPGRGGDVFRADKRDGIKKFVESACWAKNYPDLEALGTKATDLFDPTFSDAVASGAAGGGCPTADPGKALCEKWLARYKADRASLNGLKAPVVVLYGVKDATIPPERVTCAIDKIEKDGLKPTYCIEPEADHGGIVRVRSSWVADWIGNVALGEAAPAACPKGKDAIVDTAGKPATCDPIPPND